MPRVSVVISAFNAADTIGQALESAFAQSFADYEIIVVDDGSTDATVAALTPYRDRVRLIRQRNRGISAAKNAGVAVASGEYVAFLDADDLWMPERLEKSVAVLESDPRCVLVSVGALTIDKDGTPSGEYSVEPAAILTPGLNEIVSGRARIKVSSILIRRDIFERIGGFDEAAFRRQRGGEDLYLYSIASEHGTIRIVPEPLMKYRAEPTRNRMWKYDRGRRILIRKWRARYGKQIRSALAAQIRTWVRAWNQIGMEATERANLKVARSAFRAALRLEPWNWRVRGRMARTYLPPRMVARMAERRAERKRQDRAAREKSEIARN
ncbi:MAG: glycosyltransferase family 2 protein [Candidatus Binataceae bacterium]